MSSFRPGDAVDITIRGAVISDRHRTAERLWFEIDEKPYYLPANSEFVTVEPSSPWPPQPGDVWRDSSGHTWFAVGHRSGDVLLSAADGRGEKLVNAVRDQQGPLTLVHREGTDS